MCERTGEAVTPVRCCCAMRAVAVYATTTYEVRINLDCRDGEAMCLEKHAHARNGNTLPQAAYHTTADNEVFHVRAGEQRRRRLFKNEDICFSMCVKKKHSKHLARWYVSPAASVRCWSGYRRSRPDSGGGDELYLPRNRKITKNEVETENSLRRFNIFFSNELDLDST